MGILIADSGGTKTDWVYIDSANEHYFKSSGLHPAYTTGKQISEEIKYAMHFDPSEIDQVFFYGAGCHGIEPKQKIINALKQTLIGCRIDVFDDLTGAARAHLQQTEGIIAALGTGSVCGRYKNGEITMRSAALGYAIGDEGSAADLGKSVLRAYYRAELNKDARNAVEKKLGNVDYSHWMNQIYGSSQPNRELASVAEMVFSDDKQPQQLKSILINCFERFIDSQLLSLQPHSEERILFTGKVSNAHSKIILSLLKNRNFNNCSVKEGLISGLARYHKPELKIK